MRVFKMGANVPPIASEPKNGRAMRLTEDGEEVVPIRRVAEGILVRLVRDDYIAIVQPDEIV